MRDGHRGPGTPHSVFPLALRNGWDAVTSAERTSRRVEAGRTGVPHGTGMPMGEQGEVGGWGGGSEVMCRGFV